MEYSALHVRRLRERLARYRAEHLLNGHTRPWHRIATDILDTPSLPKKYYDSEDPTAMAEALRRFVSSQQMPTPERLDAIASFLTHKGLLTAEDLDQAEPPYAAAVSTQALLGGPPDAETEGGLIEGVLTGSLALRPQGLQLETLDVQPAPMPGVMYITETIIASKDAAFSDATYLARAAARGHTAITKRFREGWLICGRSGAAVAFLRDRFDGDPYTYSFPYRRLPGAGEDGFAVVLKLGPFKKPDPTALQLGSLPPEVISMEVVNWAGENVRWYRYQKAPEVAEKSDG